MALVNGLLLDKIGTVTTSLHVTGLNCLHKIPSTSLIDAITDGITVRVVDITCGFFEVGCLTVNMSEKVAK